MRKRKLARSSVYVHLTTRVKQLLLRMCVRANLARYRHALFLIVGLMLFTSFQSRFYYLEVHGYTMLFVTNKIPESSYEDILFGRRFVVQHENCEIFVRRYFYSAEDFFVWEKMFFIRVKFFIRTNKKFIRTNNLFVRIIFWCCEYSPK